MATMSPARLRNIRRWLMIGLVCAVILSCLAERSAIAVAMPAISRSLGLSGLQIGMILSGFGWTYALSQVATGFLIDRFGVRRVVLVGIAGWTAITFLTTLLDSFLVLLVLRFLLGGFEAPVFPAAIKVAGEWFPERQRGAAIGIVQAATRSAMALAPLFVAPFAAGFGWRGMYLILGLSSLVPLLAWALFFRSPEDDTAERG